MFHRCVLVLAECFEAVINDVFVVLLYILMIAVVVLSLMIFVVILQQ